MSMWKESRSASKRHWMSRSTISNSHGLASGRHEQCLFQYRYILSNLHQCLATHVMNEQKKEKKITTTSNNFQWNTIHVCLLLYNTCQFERLSLFGSIQCLSEKNGLLYFMNNSNQPVAGTVKCISRSIDILLKIKWTDQMWSKQTNTMSMFVRVFQFLCNTYILNNKKKKEQKCLRMLENVLTISFRFYLFVSFSSAQWIYCSLSKIDFSFGCSSIAAFPLFSVFLQCKKNETNFIKSNQMTIEIKAIMKTEETISYFQL